MNETRTDPRSDSERTEACRLVAELLGFRSIGTVSDTSAPIEDVLGGRVDGLIVFRPDDRGEVETIDLPHTPEERPETAIARSLDAARSALAKAGATPPAVLRAVRDSLGAQEVFFLRERDERILVTLSDPDRGSTVLPQEVHSELRGISQREPIDEGTVRQLAVVLGASGSRISAAFATDDEPLEVLVVGWGDQEPPGARVLGAVSRAVALAHEVIETRDGEVERLLREERSHLAGAIHDGLTQAVTGAYLELKTLRARIARDPETALGSLDDVMGDLRSALLEVRGVLFDLADVAEAEPGDPMVSFVAGVAERWKLPVRTTVRGDVTRVPAPVLSAAYLIVREALANVAKHAAARDVEVRVAVRPGQLRLEIEDDGRGFTPNDEPQRPGHLGLTMLRERVAEAGGTVEIDSKPGGGTRVITSLPVETQGELP